MVQAEIEGASGSHRRARGPPPDLLLPRDPMPGATSSSSCAAPRAARRPTSSPGPFQHVRALRGPAEVEGRGPLRRRLRARRPERGRAAHQGRRRLGPARARGGPATASSASPSPSPGRVHTSSATVTVLPEAEGGRRRHRPADLKIDVYRSTGPGGQSATPPTRRCASPRCRPGSLWPCRTRRARSKTGRRPMVVLRARLLKAEQTAGPPSWPSPGVVRWAAGVAARRSAPTTSKRTGHRPPGKPHAPQARPGPRRRSRRAHRRAHGRQRTRQLAGEDNPSDEADELRARLESEARQCTRGALAHRRRASGRRGLAPPPTSTTGRPLE